MNNSSIKVGDTVYTERFNKLITDRVVTEIVLMGRTTVAKFEDGPSAAIEDCHTGTLPKPKDFTKGETVQIHAFGSWYTGTVVKVGRSKVKVNYTSGSGANRDKSVNMGQIRKV